MTATTTYVLTNSPICISTLAWQDIRIVVALHRRAFPNFFLTFLGPRFLREFYISFLMDSAGIAFVARDHSETILGVVVGPVDPRNYFRRLLWRRWWAFCLASMLAVVQRPNIVPRLWRALRYRGEQPSGPVRALLSSIAVAPEVQGKHVGRHLIKAWIAEAHRRGAFGAYLTTDAEGNDVVNRFYQKLGWQLEATYITQEGRRMNRYIFDFAVQTANGRE